MKDNFIKVYKFSDMNLCNDLISFHSGSKDTYDGCVSYNGVPIVDKKSKDSIDCSLLGNEHLAKRYFSELQICLNKYIEAYPYCNWYAPFASIEDTNIQYYKPHGGYYEYHTERATAITPASNRHLVYITYLNNVTDCGETEFFHQKLKVKPEKGLTIIFPADWTFTHRGIPSPTQEKYIVTGWLNYIG